MKLGIPTLLELETAEKQIAFCNENNFEFFEMNLMFPWYQTDNIDIAELARLREKYGVGYTIHLPDDFNPFSFSPEMRKASFEIAHFAFYIAKKLEISRITMHLPEGTYVSMNGTKHYLFDSFSSIYMDNVNRFGNYCQTNLSNTDIYLCIENTKGFRSFHKRAIESLISNPNIGFTFDIGHNYKAGGEDEPYMFNFPDKVKHFHIHDVTDTGNHFGLGNGILPIEKYLKLAASTGASALIEVKELAALVSSVDYLKKRNYI